MKELSTDSLRVGIMAGILFFLALGIMGQADYEEEVLEHDIYCEFVELWEQTNGENGHPDFRGIYEKACRNEQRRN